MNMYEYVWLYNYVQLCMTKYDYMWLCMTMYDYMWLCIREREQFLKLLQAFSKYWNFLNNPKHVQLTSIKFVKQIQIDLNILNKLKYSHT